MDSTESDRLQTLRKYRILDTDPEAGFDDLTLLASQICETPMALITLVDEDRQWFKSRVGIEVQETARSVSFCAHAIQQREILVVPDTHGDERFRDNPLVTGDPHIRFYAGAPLITREGDALGTLCVADHTPRTLTPAQLEALSALRRQAQAQLELRRNLLELRNTLEGLEHLAGLVPYCSKCDLNIVIPAEIERIETVRGGLHELLESKHWPQEDMDAVELSVDEALTNAIRHGCKGDATKEVQCLVTFDEAGEVVIVVRDPGTGFDPTAVPNPLQPENMLKPSGRGVFLINQLMDAVEYADEGRQVLMRKQRGSAD